MDLSNGKGSMSTPSTSGSWKAVDVVPDQFPAGLRVLVVDDDPTCLMILDKMLRTCRYEVTKRTRAEEALSLLRENKNGFDIVISDVHMPDMDGFKLLEHIGLEMDLPVIMMSADDGKHVVLKGITHGACDYLIKPVRIEALKNIWQHVVRKRKNEWKELEQSGSVEDGDRLQKQSEDADYSTLENEGNWKNAKKRKDEDDEAEEREDTCTLKKPRVVWSVELHQQFVAAVNQLGIDKAVPKKILELMNVPGLTRENVASHLQKYRLYLRRLSGVSQHQSGLNSSFIGTQEATFGPMSSLNGLDLQALAAAGQLPAQGFITLQAAGFGRPTTKSNIPMPLVDQRNLFSFENPELRFGEGQQQQLNNNGKQLNLLHGIPTSMEPKQLANLHQSTQSYGSMNMQLNAHGSQSSSLLMQMAQPQSRGKMLNETTGSHLSRLPSSIGQPILSNGIGGVVLARNGIANDNRAAGYNLVSQTSSMLDFPVNQTAELPGNSFPLGSTPGISSIKSGVPFQEESNYNPVSQTSSKLDFPVNQSAELPGNSFPLRSTPGISSTSSKGSFQEESNSEIKGSRGFVPSYDIFNDLHQQKSHNWEIQNAGLTFGATQHGNSIQGNLGVSPSVLVHQGFPSNQRSGDNGNTLAISKEMFSSGEGIQHGNAQNIGQHLHTLVDNSLRVKAERISDNLFHESFGQEDLMSAILKQQVESEFELDGYSLDNIPA